MNWTKEEVERVDNLLSNTTFNEAVRIASEETRRSESSVRYMASGERMPNRLVSR